MATSKEQGFLAEIARTTKANPHLAKADEVKLKMSVGKLTALLKQFYEAGHSNASESGGLFGSILGQR